MYITLHNVVFFLKKSQHEPYFTYKTAEMIPSVINNRTINFTNTSFHEYGIEMYLLSGIRTIKILNCEFNHSDISFFFYRKQINGNRNTSPYSSKY